MSGLMQSLRANATGMPPEWQSSSFRLECPAAARFSSRGLGQPSKSASPGGRGGSKLFQAMRFEPPGEELDARAGFTLIEALVALAVTAASLAAIGLLVAGNIRGSGRIEHNLRLVQTL